MVEQSDERQRRGRQNEEKGTPLTVRLQGDLLADLDRMRREEGDLPTRPEMLRRILERALAGDGDDGKEEGR